MRAKRLMWLFLFLLMLSPLCARAQGASVSGTAWIDSSGDGLYQTNEKTLNRITITLYRVSGEARVKAGQATTDAAGAYSFTGLPAGEYALATSLPENYHFIMPCEGGSVMLPACGGESESARFTLHEGAALTGMHIGASKSSSYVKIYAFEDANANGGRLSTEELLRYVQTSLQYEYRGEWLTIAQAKTDREGCATYWGLTPGTYRVMVELPDPYIVGPLGVKIGGWYNCVLPGDSNIGVTAPFEAPRGGSIGLGAGAVMTGGLTGAVWYDADMNGLRDGVETGFAGALVTLEGQSAGVHRTLTTDADGAYLFERLQAGQYTLSVTLPEGYMFTLPGGDSLFSEGYELTQRTTVAVQTGQTAALQAVGAMPRTSLTVHVYNDLNANGAREADEPAFAGAVLRVLTGEQERAAVISDGAGVAHVPVLRGGDVTLRCALPPGQVFTVRGEQSDFVAPQALDEVALDISLPHGQAIVLYAGVTLPSAITGRLFNDDNVSGVLEGGESGLSGFTVQAVDAQGVVVAQARTDRDGYYALSSLLPAPHVVRFLLTESYVFSEYSDTGAQTENKVILQTPGYGQTTPVAPLPGQTVGDMNGGAFRSGTVAGSVLLNANHDALATSEGGLPGVLVTLLDEQGAPVSDTTTAYTDENGYFFLKGALPGLYSVAYTLPEGAAFAHPVTEAESVFSQPFRLSTREDITLPDIGAVYTGTLSGVLYHDSNLNGAHDPEDVALSEIPITLSSLTYETEHMTRTLDDGQYIFTGLRPGEYALSLALPGGLCVAADETSPLPPTAASSATARLTLAMGEALTGRNVAAAMPASLRGTVYFDRENNGDKDDTDTGAPGVLLTLKAVRGPQSYTLLTDETGAFSLPAMIPGAYTLLMSLEADCVPAQGAQAQLTDGFWVSELSLFDGEDKLCDWGVMRYASLRGAVWSMDGTLGGVAGRTVRLYLAQEPLQPLRETVTDERGAYHFAQLAPGSYRISCDLPHINYKFAREQDAARRASVILSTADSNAAGEALSAPIALAMGEHKDGQDIGIGAMGKLGDTAWLDTNGNGCQDGGEPGVPGIEITLIQYGQVIASTVTDAYGHYLFTDLYPGAYDVQVTLHKELKTTLRQTDYPLVASVLPESNELVVTAEGIIVPSDGRNLNCDMGFLLRRKGKLPAAMSDLPTTDWSFGK